MTRTLRTCALTGLTVVASVLLVVKVASLVRVARIGLPIPEVTGLEPRDGQGAPA